MNNTPINQPQGIILSKLAMELLKIVSKLGWALGGITTGFLTDSKGGFTGSKGVLQVQKVVALLTMPVLTEDGLLPPVPYP